MGQERPDPGVPRVESGSRTGAGDGPPAGAPPAVPHELFALMFEQGGSACFTAIARRVPQEQAEDIALEVVVRAAEQLARDPHYFEHHAYERWASSVAKNFAINAARKGSSERRRAPEHMRERAEDAAEWMDPAVGLDQAERSERLAIALGALEETRRQALILCTVGGRTFDEAATEMGTSRSRVVRLVAKAREALRAKLVDWGPDAERAARAALSRFQMKRTARVLGNSGGSGEGLGR